MTTLFQKISLIAILCVPTFLSAQNVKYRGQVIDYRTDSPSLEGYTIWAVGGDTVTTDMEGKFELTFVEEVPEDFSPIVYFQFRDSTNRRIQNNQGVRIFNFTNAQPIELILPPHLQQPITLELLPDKGKVMYANHFWDYLSFKRDLIYDNLGLNKATTRYHDLPVKEKNYLDLIQYGYEQLLSSSQAYFFPHIYREIAQMNFSDALAQLDHPDDVEQQLLAARIYCYMGDMDKAIEKYKEVINDSNGRYGIHNEFTYLLFEQGFNKQAFKVRDLMIQEIPESTFKAEHLINLAAWTEKANIAKNRIEEGLKMYTYLSQEYPKVYALSEEGYRRQLGVIRNVGRKVGSTKNIKKTIEHYELRNLAHEMRLQSLYTTLDEHPNAANAREVAKMLGRIAHELEFFRSNYQVDYSVEEIKKTFLEAIELQEEYGFDANFELIINNIDRWREKVEELERL
ncbi:MAG: hypothetical protein AAGI23_21615 [Bacteroidota bacterium]